MAVGGGLVAAGIPVVFAPGEESAAELLRDAIRQASEVLRRRWHLAVPQGCTAHVLSDWRRFVLGSAPRGRRWLARLTLPLWGPRAARMFPAVGGWTIPWAGGPAVGVKAATELGASSGLGSELFAPVPSPLEKMTHVACHELTHACTAHLKLPPWVNEGVAMRAVDHLAGTDTVLLESRKWIRKDVGGLSSRSFRRAVRRNPSRLIEVYATGYWAARSLEERDPDALRSALSPALSRTDREALFLAALQSLHLDGSPP